MNAPARPAENTSLQRAQRQADVVRALQAVVPAHALLWQATLVTVKDGGSDTKGEDEGSH